VLELSGAFVFLVLMIHPYNAAATGVRARSAGS
jgi:hypothetical protein